MHVQASFVVKRGNDFIQLKVAAQVERVGEQVELTGFAIVGQDQGERIRLHQLSHREISQAFRALAEACTPKEEPEPARWRPYLVPEECSL